MKDQFHSLKEQVGIGEGATSESGTPAPQTYRPTGRPGSSSASPFGRGSMRRVGRSALARSGRLVGSSPNMTKRMVASDAALSDLAATRAFEAFYEAEARTLFRRLWLITGNRAEAE